MTDLAASRRAAAIRVYEAAELALRGIDRDSDEGNRWANIASEAAAIVRAAEPIAEHAKAGEIGPRPPAPRLRLVVARPDPVDYLDV